MNMKKLHFESKLEIEEKRNKIFGRSLENKRKQRLPGWTFLIDKRKNIEIYS